MLPVADACHTPPSPPMYSFFRFLNDQPPCLYFACLRVCKFLNYRITTAPALPSDVFFFGVNLFLFVAHMDRL
jgi:hypothetical protein